MERPDTIVWQECESPWASLPNCPSINSPLLCGISFSSRGFVSEQALVKQAFVCGQLVGTHTPLLVGDNEEAVSGAAAVGLKGNTDGKKGAGRK